MRHARIVYGETTFAALLLVLLFFFLGQIRQNPGADTLALVSVSGIPKFYLIRVQISSGKVRIDQRVIICV